MMEKLLMKFSITAFTLGLLLAGTSMSFGRDDKSHRVLFLGNSVFYSRGGLYQSFEGFCKAAGLDYQAVSQLNTPANLHGIEFLDFGRIPLNLPEVAAQDEIHTLIRSGQFDYVIVEGRRPGYLLPAWVELPDNRGQSGFRQNSPHYCGVRGSNSFIYASGDSHVC
jgi:hypothetical protein